MIYIDTRTKNSMELDLCNCLKIEKSNLLELYERIHSIQDTENCDSAIKKFITNCSNRSYLDEVQLFHLARRFTDCELDGRIGYNLKDLLTVNSKLKNFLEYHKINFIYDEGVLLLSVDGDRVNLDNIHDTNVCYLRSRLGYNSGIKDFCFNGFALKDLIEKNDYFLRLKDGPELLISLADFLNKQDMLDEYIKNTTYYCYEYRFPIDMVIIDGKQELQNDEKEIFILTRIIYRLYEYEYLGHRKMSDSDNIILRLPDSMNAEEKYYITREEC